MRRILLGISPSGHLSCAAEPPIFIRRYGAELRLYEREEDEECRPARLALQAMHGAIIREPPDMQKRLKHRRRGVPYHVLRFYDIVKGFHLVRGSVMGILLTN